MRCPICDALPEQPCRNPFSAREVRHPHLNRAQVADEARCTGNHIGLTHV
ncbi:zinc finger domain-containing protein [Mycobacterium sp.]